jgi:hypothetical protein
VDAQVFGAISTRATLETLAGALRQSNATYRASNDRWGPSSRHTTRPKGATPKGHGVQRRTVVDSRAAPCSSIYAMQPYGSPIEWQHHLQGTWLGKAARTSPGKQRLLDQIEVEWPSGGSRPRLQMTVGIFQNPPQLPSGPPIQVVRVPAKDILGHDSAVSLPSACLIESPQGAK